MKITDNLKSLEMNDRDLERYDIDKFIDHACQMNYIDLMKHCIQQCDWLNNRKRSRKKEDEYAENVLRKYNDFIGGLTFMLYGNKIKPGGMDAEDFPKTKKIFEALIAKGQWKDTWLDFYE